MALQGLDIYRRPAGNYMFKVNNRNRTWCEICSELTIKTAERRQWLEFVNCYHKTLYLGCCSSPRSTSVYHTTCLFLCSLKTKYNLREIIFPWFFVVQKRCGEGFKAELKLINPFHASGLFWYPLTRGFLMFSGGIERDQWHEMG